MKRAAAGLGIVLALVAAVVLVRGATLASRQVDVEPAPALELEARPIAEHLALVLKQRTLSSQDPAQVPTREFRGLHALLRALYPLAHRRLERESVSGLSLLYTWPGSDASLEPILLAAHQDVVPVDPDGEDEWEHPPFQGVVADGTVWGRGALDDKGGLICIFEAIEYLLAQGFQPERTVYLALGHDEEVGGNDGAAAIAELLEKRGRRLAWVLDEGGLIASEFLEGVAAPVAMVGIAEKGYLGIALEIEAPGGHSSVPPRHTAIGDLSSAVVALESNPMPASLGGVTALFLDTLAPELGFPARVVLANRWLFGPLLPWAFSRLPVMDAMQRTTTAVTIFQSGVKENVLPTQARAVANFRIHPSDTVESVVDHVRDTIDDERIALQVGVRSPPQEPSPVSPVDSKGFTTLERTIRAVFPGTAVVPYLVLGGTDARHYQRLSDDVYRFLPFVFGPEALRLAHGSNERISIDNLAGGVRFYVRLLRAGAGAAAP